MENEVDELLDLLKNYEESHPNFVKIWNRYLREKIDNLKNTIKSFKILLNDKELKNAPDLDANVLATIISMI